VTDILAGVEKGLVSLGYDISESNAKPDRPAIGALLVTASGRTTLMALVPDQLNTQTAIAVTRSLHPAPPGVAAVTTGFLHADTLELHDGTRGGGTLLLSPGARRQPTRTPRTGRPPSDRPEHTHRFIYLIHAPDSACFRIGTSRDPEGRMRYFQTMSPTRLMLVATTSAPVNPYEKTLLHRRFAAQRTHGEWFSDNTLEDAVAMLKQL